MDDDALGMDTDSDDELPHGWEERTTSDGWVYYANHQTQTTRWEHPKTNKRRMVPADLPYGWNRHEDEEGRSYFVDHVNKKTTYTDPRLAFAVDVDIKSGNAFRQRFDANSTTDQVLQGSDLRGVVAIVTGATAGIGCETARALACHGAKVVMACRNMKKTEQVIADIKRQRDDVDLIGMELDLESLKSVQQFAQKFLETEWPLHILILNAGVFQLPWKLTEDAIERTFAINHVGHFYLTKLLTPHLLKCAPARVVVVSSESHRFPVGPDPLALSKLSPPASQFWPMIQYNRTKLCNVLFSNELNRRLGGLGVMSFALHPGNMMYTSISSSSWLYRWLFFMARPFTKSMKQGAACSVWAATAPELEARGGLYLNNCFPCEPSELARNRDEAKKLWKLTDELIKERFENRAESGSFL